MLESMFIIYLEIASPDFIYNVMDYVILPYDINRRCKSVSGRWEIRSFGQQ